MHVYVPIRAILHITFFCGKLLPIGLVAQLAECR